jgi:hypothetical protein
MKQPGSLEPIESKRVIVTEAADFSSFDEVPANRLLLRVAFSYSMSMWTHINRSWPLWAITRATRREYVRVGSGAASLLRTVARPIAHSDPPLTCRIQCGFDNLTDVEDPSRDRQ